jgi:hypothetical protein
MSGKLSKYPLRGLNTKECVLFVGNFTPTVGGSYPVTLPLASRTNGPQFSVTKTAAGTYSVVMADKYVTAINANVLISGPVLPSSITGVSMAVQCSAFNTTVANGFQVITYNPSTPLAASAVTPVDGSSVPTGTTVQLEFVFRLTGSPD